ncbi:hypothetical protein L7F22_016361 [Adiantum nelumboides]|nr:hypothetical protein [Adiantum nelumboides]
MEALEPEKGHEGSSQVVGDKQRKSRSRRHIGVEDFPLGVGSTPYDLISNSDAGFVLITIYVDDLIITGDNETEIEHVKGLLKEFEMKDLGELRYFLGLEVIRTTEGIWLSQRQYALNMLSKYGMADCKPMSQRQYALDMLSKYGMADLHRTLRYVRATLDHALFYAADVPVELHGYTNADWAGSATNQRSTSGFMFTLGSAAITWSRKKHPTVALFSTETEYGGAAVAACEATRLRKLLMDLKLQVDREVVIY